MLPYYRFTERMKCFRISIIFLLLPSERSSVMQTQMLDLLTSRGLILINHQLATSRDPLAF